MSNPTSPTDAKLQISDLAIDDDITLRRMTASNPQAKDVVLFLHGFPETMLAWKGVAETLAAEGYEVHAFDWPGYGLSSTPSADRFAYAPRDFARVLKTYIDKAGIDRSKLLIYATDIASLPTLLAAIEDPSIAKSIVVGDFAPFHRPHHMHEMLRTLKDPATAEASRAGLNARRDEVLGYGFGRGMPDDAQPAISDEFKADLARGWDNGEMTAADAFYHYYSHFKPDQDFLEANVGRVKTPVTVMWGEKDYYLDPAMGQELADKLGVPFKLLPGMGHYPHLQAPEQTVEHVRALTR